MRRLIGLLGVLSLVALAAPALAAMREKTRRASEGRDTFDETADELDVAAIFDSLDVVSRSIAFRGGDVIAWYGGGTLDLRQATLDPDGAELRVRAMFGGLEIAVPTTWPVEVHAARSSRERATRAIPHDVDPSLPTLVVDAQAIFGGVAIVGARMTSGLPSRWRRPPDPGASGRCADAPARMGLWYVASGHRIAQTAP